MLLLHGFTGSGESWPAPILEGLASRGRLPVRPDLPGHGRHAGDRDAGHFTLEATLGAVAAAQGDQPCPVAGYSMGGRIALAFALTWPERVTHLILESSSPGLESDEERADRRTSDEALATRLEAGGIEAFVDHWERLPLFESQQALAAPLRETQRRRRLANDPGSLAASLRGVGTGALPSYWNRLATVEVPTLLIAGALDRKFTALARRMAERLPRAEVVVAPDAGHAVHLERPDVWLDSVLGFLSRSR